MNEIGLKLVELLKNQSQRNRNRKFHHRLNQDVITHKKMKNYLTCRLARCNVRPSCSTVCRTRVRAPKPAGVFPAAFSARRAAFEPTSTHGPPSRASVRPASCLRERCAPPIAARG